MNAAILVIVGAVVIVALCLWVSRAAHGCGGCCSNGCGACSCGCGLPVKRGEGEELDLAKKVI